MIEGNNVRFEVRERGKLVTVRDIHNVWTDTGRQFIAEMLGFTSLDPDVPERSDGVEFFGFGMGSISQNQQAMVTSPPLSNIFQIGSTPHGSSGFDFRHDFGSGIPSIELPVPAQPTTVTNIYGTSFGAQWRLRVDGSDASAYSAHPATNIFRITGTFRLGEMVHVPPLSGNEYHLLPLSEAGLFTSNAPGTTTPFLQPSAYVNFDTIQVSQDTDLFVVWDVIL